MRKTNLVIISLLVASLIMWIVISVLLGISIAGTDKSTGSDRKSAFEIFKEYHPEYEGTEEEWLESLKGTNDGKDDHEVTWFSGYEEPANDLEGALDGDFYVLLYDDFSDYEGFVLYTMKDGQWTVVMDMTTEKSKDDNSDSTELSVHTASGFVAFSDMVNNGKDNFQGKTIKLETDLDLSSIESWTPIGSTSATRFMGEFDGGGHMISNLTINSNSSYNGLFGWVGPSTADSKQKSSIHDLTLNNVTVIGKSYSAALVAYTFTDTEIYNINVTGDVKISAKNGNAWGDTRVGAVVASVDYSTIHDVTVNVNAGSIVETDGPYAGGIIGFSSESDNASRVYYNLKSNIDVTGGWIVGGLFGMLHRGATVRDCVVEGATVTMTGNSSGAHAYAIGGIAGNTSVTDKDVPVLLDNCKFVGTLVNEVGATNICAYGLTGPTQNLEDLRENITIKNCESQATLSDGSVLKATWNESGEVTVNEATSALQLVMLPETVTNSRRYW